MLLRRSALSLTLLLCHARVLHAEPSAAQKENARSLMAEGRALREQHDLQGALSRFRAADDIMAVPTTGFELARAQADLNLLVEARSTIRRVLTSPAREGEPAPFQEARSKAEALDAELEPRIASLHFELGALAPGEVAKITVDGEAVAPAAVAMLYRVNPGHHRIEAHTVHTSASRELDVAEHEVANVPLEFSADSAREVETQSSLPPTTRHVPTVAYVAGGIGVAGLLVGTVTGVLALSSKRSAEAGCRDQQCPPSTWSDLDRAHSLATVSTVGFIVGAVGVGVGVGSFLFASPDAPSSAVQARFSVSGGTGSLSLSGSF